MKRYNRIVDSREGIVNREFWRHSAFFSALSLSQEDGSRVVGGVRGNGGGNGSSCGGQRWGMGAAAVARWWQCDLDFGT